MVDIKKFLDQSGVSTLWNQVVAEINAKVAAVPTYNDTQVKADIAANKAAIEAEVSRATLAEQANADDIAALVALVGEETVANQIATKIAEVVAEAPESFDTLKEIAAWINTHASDATGMNKNITDNAAAITALQGLVGDKKVATQIAEAIAAAGHASASDLAGAIERIAALEAWKASHATEYTNLNTAFNTLKGKVDEITATGGEPNVLEIVQINGVAKQATDKTINIVSSDFVAALTEAEIKSACGKA